MELIYAISFFLNFIHQSAINVREYTTLFHTATSARRIRSKAGELSPSINVVPDDEGVSRSVERADTNVCFAKHLGRGSDGAARTARRERERKRVSRDERKGEEKGR